jgi:hypothetical protein
MYLSLPSLVIKYPIRIEMRTVDQYAMHMLMQYALEAQIQGPTIFRP